ncbi:MAG TPA: replication initiator [Streptosporangiaceae bacterium]|nr:replication initiator [Streptosporangiaceae bacterium]
MRARPPGPPPRLQPYRGTGIGPPLGRPGERFKTHAEERPLCPGCYDYPAAVLVNANAADLWRRFITYLPRRLATLASVIATQLRRDIRIRYVKVAEYQARGVVHFHAVIRLDASGTEDGSGPPIAGVIIDAA